MIDYEYLLRDTRRTEKHRDTPLLTSGLGEYHPLDHLACLVMLWPPRDIRYQEYIGGDELFMVEIANGMETSLGPRKYDQGILDLFVEFQSNMDEYERFNQAAAKHNREWSQFGAPSEYIDPVTGVIIPVDGYVNKVRARSKYNYYMPHDPDARKGKLASQTPDMNRRACVLVRYKLNVVGDAFYLGFAAYDPKGRVVYYNNLSGTDLAALVRRSTQEIWGNFKAADAGDEVLNGITMLIQGKKIPHCQKNNTVPDFLGDGSAQIKTRNPELRAAEFEQGTASALEKALAGPIPILIFIAMLMFTAHCIHGAIMWDQPTGGLFITGIAIFIGLLIGCRKLSQHMSRKVSEIDADKKFM